MPQLKHGQGARVDPLFVEEDFLFHPQAFLFVPREPYNISFMKITCMVLLDHCDHRSLALLLVQNTMEISSEKMNRKTERSIEGSSTG